MFSTFDKFSRAIASKDMESSSKYLLVIALRYQITNKAKSNKAKLYNFADGFILHHFWISNQTIFILILTYFTRIFALFHHCGAKNER